MQTVTQELSAVNPDSETVGWRMFFAGRLKSECRNADERAGWEMAFRYSPSLVGVFSC